MVSRTGLKCERILFGLVFLFFLQFERKDVDAGDPSQAPEWLRAYRIVGNWLVCARCGYIHENIKEQKTEKGAGTRSEAGGTTATTEGSGKTNFIPLLLLKTQNNDLGGLTPSSVVYLRMGMRLMRNGECYIPPELRAPTDEQTLQQLRTYYLQLWPKILDKWIKAKAVKTAFHPDNPLGQWRERIEKIYDLKLPLPKN